MKVNRKTSLLDAIDAAPKGNLALIDQRDSVSYGELRQLAGQIATKVHRQYGSGEFILLRAASEVCFVTTLLGIMLSGNTPIPVAPNTPKEEIDYIRDKSSAVAILDPMKPETYAEETSSDHRDESLPALILFTSGTTGRPKGVVVSNDNLQHSCETIADYLDYHTHASAAVVLPLHYSYALLSQVLCLLKVHGRVRLFEGLRNPIKVARAIAELELETFCGVPSTYHALTEFHRMSPIVCPSIRVLCSAGAAINHSQLKNIRHVFPRAMFFNNYGMTEAAPRIAFIREDDPRFHEPTCGRPMAGVTVKVVDPENRRELAEGETGILAISGPNITEGYLNDPQRTAEAFTEDGYILSNDLATLDKGYIFLSGRYDDLFNVSGEKVSPMEIERVLNEIPGVVRSAVLGVPDASRGKVPVAFLQLQTPLSRREIVAATRGTLLGTKVPQRYYAVSGFPTTPNGKLKRRELETDDDRYVLYEIK